MSEELSPVVADAPPAEGTGCHAGADTITFANATTEEKMTVEIIAVRHYLNTRLMLESEGVKNVLSSGLDIEGGIESYNSFSEYRENIPKYGIYAIEIKVKL